MKELQAVHCRAIGNCKESLSTESLQAGADESCWQHHESDSSTFTILPPPMSYTVSTPSLSAVWPSRVILLSLTFICRGVQVGIVLHCLHVHV